jgi:hypothetical protein
MFRPQEKCFTVAPPPQAVFRPPAPAAVPGRKEGPSGAGDCGDVAEKNFAANPGTVPPREALPKNIDG